jgi:hypothetical protein
MKDLTKLTKSELEKLKHKRYDNWMAAYGKEALARKLYDEANAEFVRRLIDKAQRSSHKK